MMGYIRMKVNKYNELKSGEKNNVFSDTDYLV